MVGSQTKTPLDISSLCPFYDNMWSCRLRMMVLVLTTQV